MSEPRLWLGLAECCCVGAWSPAQLINTEAPPGFVLTRWVLVTRAAKRALTRTWVYHPLVPGDDASGRRTSWSDHHPDWSRCRRTRADDYGSDSPAVHDADILSSHTLGSLLALRRRARDIGDVYRDTELNTVRRTT
jgi:hypothetical protein